MLWLLLWLRPQTAVGNTLLRDPTTGRGVEKRGRGEGSSLDCRGINPPPTGSPQSISGPPLARPPPESLPPTSPAPRSTAVHHSRGSRRASRPQRPARQFLPAR